MFVVKQMRLVGTPTLDISQLRDPQSVPMCTLYTDIIIEGGITIRQSKAESIVEDTSHGYTCTCLRAQLQLVYTSYPALNDAMLEE